MVLKSHGYLLTFLILTLLVAFLLFLIPVNTIPGNDIKFQASLFGLVDYISLFVVAALESLLLVMLIYLFREARRNEGNIAALGQGNLGILSGVPAFLFGSKLCPMCLAGIFGSFGPGAVMFTFEYRNWIFAASTIVLLSSVWSVSRKINGVCEHCLTIEKRKQKRI